jgi:tetratricopeptide (TPR) repeat protein
MPAAASLLGRAAATLSELDPARLALLPDLSEALTELGRFQEAERFLDEAIAAARASGDERLLAEARLTRLLVERYAGQEKGWARRTESEAGRSMPILEAWGDHVGLTKAWRLLTWVHGPAGRYAEAAAAAERVVEHARQSGDQRQEARGAVSYAMAALYGPTPVSEAIQRCQEIVGQVESDKRTLGLVLCCLAQLRAMDGDFERARELYRQARSTLEDVGAGVVAASTSLNSWWVEMLAGDAASAERELRRDYEALEAMGEQYLLSTVAAALAQVAFAQDRLDEADAVSKVALGLADEDDIDSQALARCVRAKVLARRAEAEDGQRLAREALALVRGSQNPVLLAHTLVDLAHVLLAAGELGEAEEALAEALGLFRSKGDRVSAQRAEAMLAMAAPA